MSCETLWPSIGWLWSPIYPCGSIIHVIYSSTNYSSTNRGFEHNSSDLGKTRIITHLTLAAIKKGYDFPISLPWFPGLGRTTWGCDEIYPEILIPEGTNTMKNPIKSLKPPFSYGFPMVFLWFSYGFPYPSLEAAGTLDDPGTPTMPRLLGDWDPN